MKEYEAMERFHRIVNMHAPPFGNEHDAAAILRSVEWEIVTKEATEARWRLHALLRDPEERVLLEKKL